MTGTGRRRRMALLGVLVAAASASCRSAADSTELLVFAASSLSHAFEEVGAAFEARHPESRVQVSSAASSALREQILEGAPADVFASANEETMAQIADAGLVDGAPVVFALNAMEIAVPSANPGAVSGLADLARPELLIGLCAAQVPCGDYARSVLAAAGIAASIDTDEPDAGALMSKIEAGELDAAIVYRSDVAASDRARGIEIPAADNVGARYLIAALSGSGHPGAAARFVEFVRSEPGRAILAEHGFGVP